MEILIIGEKANYHEAMQKFGDGHAYSLVSDHREAEKFLQTHDLVLDFIIDEEPASVEIYAAWPVTAMLNTCKVSLGELLYALPKNLPGRIFGFNGMPTFVNRPVLEAALSRPDDEPALRKVCSELKTDVQIVDDRVGLVTPRVVCMIINEAYYTAQEGTATREDIDLAMRLGTNYPHGPFEWCRLIGIRHVYELLDAVYEDTKDERYKICPALKKEYLKG